MTSSANAQRRKITTYGKGSHKPIITVGNAFAKAAEAEVWDAKNNTQEEGASYALGTTLGIRGRCARIGPRGGDTSSKILHVSPNALPTKLTRKATAYSLTPGPGERKKDLFDVIVSADDDSREMVSASPLGARKRKRITKEIDMGNGLLVYDDASLQRHIAAESRRELDCHISYVENGAARDKAHSSPPACDVRQEQTDAFCEEAPGPRKAGRNKKKFLEPEIDTDRRTVNNKPKPRVGARSSDTNVFRTEKRLHKLPKAIAVTSDIAASSTLAKQMQSVSTLASIGGGKEEPVPSDEEPYYPTTPPKVTKITGGTTTPRQQKLWNKLLDEDVLNKSPSSLDLPGLKLTNTRHKGIDDLVSERRTSRDSNEGATPKPRRSRLVDTLYSFHEQQSGSEDSGDDSRASSSCSPSESIKSTPSTMEPAVTLRSLANPDDLNMDNGSHSAVPSGVPQSDSSLHGVGLMVTYARQRSYLTNHDLDEVSLLDDSIAPVPFDTRGQSRKDFNKLQSTSQSMQSPEELEDNHAMQGGAMRSIHELREAGGNVRLASELEVILDDLDEKDPGSRNLRRNSLLDLVTKLLEPSTCHLFVHRGLEPRLLSHVGSVTDVITNSLVAAAILLLVANSSSVILISQIRNPRITHFLIDLLELDRDLLSEVKLRELNLSKYTQQEYLKLCNSLRKSAIWRSGKPSLLSCNILALQCLDCIVQQTRESGCLPEILSSYAMRRIVGTSIPAASIPLPQWTPTAALQVELGVSILEICTIIRHTEFQEDLWEGSTLERVAGLLPLLDALNEDDMGTWRTLTLYVNLTNNSPRLCEELSRTTIIKVLVKVIIANFEKLSNRTIKNQRSMLLNKLILSLGVLVNLAESCDAVRRLIMTSGEGEDTYLAILLKLFTKMSESTGEVYSEEETNLNVAFGYLCVLLGFLCLNRRVRTWVSSKLQGGDLQQLVGSLEMFLQYYRKVGVKTLSDEAEEDPRRSFVGRLQGLVKDLKG